MFRAVFTGAFIFALMAAPAMGAAPAFKGPDKNPAAAAAGTYKLDRGHSSVTVKVSHQGLSDYSFRFARFDASYDYDPKRPSATRVTVTLDPASLDAGDKSFEENLREPAYFNTAQFTEVKFASTAIRRQKGTNKGTMTGDLTWMGVTRPVTFAVIYNGSAMSFNRAKMGFSATTTLTRSEWGIKTLLPSVADKVAVSIEAEFAKS